MSDERHLPCAESVSVEPYYDDGQITLYHGDCNWFMLAVIPQVDCIVTDPPYGDTSLEWDRTPDPTWLERAGYLTSQLWCFGSLRFWFDQRSHFCEAGWRYAQDIVWEKHTGSGFAADRFRRVHEHAVHWYRGDWKALHKDVPTTMLYGTEAKVRVSQPPHHASPAHTGEIRPHTYESDGERLQRSVIQSRSEHGRAVHPTQKPLGILRPLITYSCPVDGVVLDPFAGSGSTLLAARDEGRRAIGVEAREDYCEAAVKRFSQGVLAA